jgi:aspartyl-tRNA(Asn)/glutamyl-tRNA(Gln) amidotransferase subunit C
MEKTMAITREEVLHVARLARLELSEEEVERFAGQLSAILDAVSKVDLADVPPTSHPLEISNAWDEDEPRPCLPLDDVFANAPDRDGDYFRSPPA